MLIANLQRYSPRLSDFDKCASENLHFFTRYCEEVLPNSLFSLQYWHVLDHSDAL